MKNTIIPQGDITKAKAIVDSVNDYVSNHEMEIPNIEDADDTVQRVHTLLYLDIMKDIINVVGILESFLSTTEEKFIEIVTDKGELSIEEVEKRLMAKMLIDLIADK